MSQQLEALERANTVRFGGAALKRYIGSLSPDDAAQRVADILRRPDATSGAITIEDLLCSIRYLGPGKASRLIAMAQIRSAQRVRDLTPGRRESLARLITGPERRVLGRTA